MPINSVKKINGDFKNKDIVSLSQFSPKDLEILFMHTQTMADIGKNAKPSDLLKGNIVTLLFYEPSSRTFGSFDAAVKQLGGQTITIMNPQEFSSAVKGETLKDTIRVFEAYCDAIIIRHPEVKTAEKAAYAAQFVPIINAGDGVGEHPTQALLDLYTIYERFKTLENLTIVAAGDMLNGRTVHSLIQGLSLYKGNTVYLLSPKELKLSEEHKKQYEQLPITLIEIEEEREIPKNAHVWYWTRVQKERFTSHSDYEALKNKYVAKPQLLQEYGNKNLILMHPLPRVGDISEELDSDPRSIYLINQTRNGMYIRMALIALVLGKL